MKVLVADDDSVVRMLLERQLQEWDHKVLLAKDGVEAMQLIEQDPDLEVLLLDWMMPGIDGLDLCRRTRQLARDHYTFIILMTSRSGKEDFLAGMSAGADDFMTKPLDADELRVRMHSAERVIHHQTEAQVQAAVASELLEIDRMKSSVIALTSHEWRSPLALVLLNLELLSKHEAMRLPGNGKILTSLSNATERLSRIVEEVLKASRDGKYVKDLNLEHVDMGAVVKRTVEGVAPFAALRAQKIDLDMASGIPRVWIDPGKISDALANLLMNAVKFSPDGSSILVRLLRNEGGDLYVSVTDTGIGISEADKSHMFERLFSTLDITHHSSGYYEFGKRGIGLGLAIAKDFVEMHGGQVGFESEEGRGSCFHFTIPVVHDANGKRVAVDEPTADVLSSSDNERQGAEK